MSAAQTWDGESYDRISGPMHTMGVAVLDRLALAGTETVIDAGCGSGRVTEALLQRLPHGRVLAVDSSGSMVDAARKRLAGIERVEVIQADLCELRLDTTVDAILSTATFHWIVGHDALFSRLHAILRPGGRLVAQCGGEGNVSKLRARAGEVLARDPYAQALVDFQAPWNYASPSDTEARLLAAGFGPARCWLAPTPQEPEHAREFLATVVLGPHVRHLPEELRRPFMDEIMRELGSPVVVDYVRLNIDAIA